MYRTLRQCVDDLAATRQLVRIDEEIDANLEAAEIHRRVNRAGGPALLFARVKGCAFPMVSNLFGTLGRARYIFRDSLDSVRRLIEMKIDPRPTLKSPARWLDTGRTALTMLPKRVTSGPVMAHETTIDKLPQLKCWPNDGGAFITLPLVYTEDLDQPGWRHSNLGMYRIQLSGGQYRQNEEVGMHYQIHRGIGVHHTAAVRRGEPLRVNIFVGGTPAMMLAAVMPLPEGMSELSFAGALARHRIPLIYHSDAHFGHLPIYAEADFCITGTVEPGRTLPEGPFGDHLGYYSLAHPFPVLRVEKVYHRPDPIWPFTVVGRPPQEDTVFGQLIHELTGPIIPTIIAGVRAVHAVDAAGVHPLLLAIGSERYTPYAEPARPQELLTQANAILGAGPTFAGQISVDRQRRRRSAPRHPQHRAILRAPAEARRLAARPPLPNLHHHRHAGLLRQPAERRLESRHRRRRPGPTPTAHGIAARLATARRFPQSAHLPARHAGDRRTQIQFASPQRKQGLSEFCAAMSPEDSINQFPLIVIVDDSQFTARIARQFPLGHFHPQQSGSRYRRNRQLHRR